MVTTKIAILRYLTGLFLILFVSRAAISKDVYGFETAQKKTVTTGPDVFDVWVAPTGILGEYDVYVIETSSFNALNQPGGMYFFIIMPDGNFLGLDQKVNYKSTYKFQAEAGNFTFQLAPMQVWAFKKNDPTPPPGLMSFYPKYFNNTTSGAASFAINSTTNLDRASNYLNSGDAVKIGTSWSPWIYSSGSSYYFVVISFTNTWSNAPVSGTVVIDSCLTTAVRFTVNGYIAYNLMGTKLWNNTPNSIPLDRTFHFSGLRKGEVRHIYLKVEDNGNNSSTVVPEFRAQLFDTVNQIQATDCLGGVLSEAPYDPNNKLVDQANCTLNGNGKLGYTIVFQNEGNGFTSQVIIEDKFPSAINASPVMNFAMKSQIPNSSILYPTFKPNTVCFYLGNSSQPYKLPGLAQSNPRHYTFDETIGWIKFDVSATCPGSGSAIKNSATINFVDPSGNILPDIITEPAVTQPDEISRPNWPVVPKKLKWWQRLFKIKKR